MANKQNPKKKTIRRIQNKRRNVGKILRAVANRPNARPLSKSVRPSRTRNTYGAKLGMVPVASTLPGAAWIKNAFAAPDFQSLECYGIPDRFIGKTITKQHVLSFDLPTQAGKDAWIIVSPAVGIGAFANTSDFVTNAPPINTSFTSVPFIDSSTTFPPNFEDFNFNHFRYCSLVAEVVAIGNPLTTPGSISVVKSNIDMTIVPTTGGTSGPLQYVLSGTPSLAAIFNRSDYVKPISLGAYSVSTHTQPDWNFRPTIKGIGPLAGPYTSGDTGDLVEFFDGPRPAGWGEMDSIIFRYMSGDSTSTPILHINVWATVEYQVQEASLLQDMAHRSPGLDQHALDLYLEMADKLPTAVPSAKNSGFWDFILKAVSGVGGLLSAIPGPVGAIAGGAAGIAGLLSRKQRKNPKVPGMATNLLASSDPD